LNAKAVAALIAGIMILSFVFLHSGVSYPSGPLKVKPPNVKIPKHVREKYRIAGYLFDPQYIEPDGLKVLGLGISRSAVLNFTFKGNGTTTITGTIYNASSGLPLRNTYLYVFASPLFTYVLSDYRGQYALRVYKLGEMNLTFKINGYQDVILNFDLNVDGGTIHRNIYFHPSQKIAWDGYTVSPNGTTVPNATLIAQGFFNTVSYFKSNSRGYFSVRLYEDSYNIIDNTPGYVNLTVPRQINLSAPTSMNLTLYRSNHTIVVYGFVYNGVNKRPISKAEVSCFQTDEKVLTSDRGNYSIKVDYGMNRIVTSHKGYFTNTSYLFESYQNTVFNYNINLYPLNPFGSSGVNLGNASAFPRLVNGSSSLNHNTSGFYTLSGYVISSVTGKAVSNVAIGFYINIDGSVYLETFRTNSTGHYYAHFIYKGNYSVLVRSLLYKERILNFSINSGNDHLNFSLTPLNPTLYNVSGYVLNFADGAPVYSAEVAVYSQYLRFVVNYSYSNGTGFFPLNLPEGNYTLETSHLGYRMNFTPITVLGNRTLVIYLKPLTTLPSGNSVGLKQLGYSADYGLPDLSPYKIRNILSGNGQIIVNLTLPLYIKFVSTSGAPLANSNYVIYFKTLGNYYYATGYTNSSGFAIFSGILYGTYQILPETFYYRGSPVNISVNLDQYPTKVTVNLTPEYLLSGGVTLENSYNISRGIAGNVPAKNLELTNSILPLYESISKTLSATKFAFSGYNATFNFTYSNPYFVPLPFNLTFSGSSASVTGYPDPYEIEVFANVTLQWSGEVLQNGNSTHFTVLPVNNVMVTAGNAVVSFSTHNLSKVYQKKVTLDISNPHARVYLNQTVSNLYLQFNSLQFSSNHVIVSYSGNVPSGFVIYGGIIPYSVPVNSSLVIQNNTVGATLNSSTNFTSFSLWNYFVVKNDYVNLSIVIFTNDPSSFSANLENLTVSCYVVVIK